MTATIPFRWVRLAVAAALPALFAAGPAHALVFTSNDLVLSIYGDGVVPHNAAAPIVLQQITTSGVRDGALVLPQATTTVNGVTQYAISGEYGSSSEGTLQRSADGKSLVIAGYGVNAATFNAGGPAVYGAVKDGQPALAQTTSVPGGTFAAVPRVVASIGANGSVDTSTALYNVFDGNNPRSVATVDGSTFYLAGQGAVNGAGSGGVVVAAKGATRATAIDTSSDYRTASIYKNRLYASRDYNGAGGTQATTVDSFAAALPSGSSAPVALNGIGPTITLTANGSNGNVVNASRNGTTVYLSPENYFFANDTTLYIADSGNPKNGNVNRASLGEGGLQKWTLANGIWSLAYDIFQGLGLVKNATSNTVAVTNGTSGLIGLAGKVVGDNVFLYATNSTLGETDATGVYAVVDSLSNTNAGVGTAETFKQIFTADRGTIVRGIAFAPEDGTAVPEPASILLLGGLAAVAGLVRRRR